MGNHFDTSQLSVGQIDLHPDYAFASLSLYLPCPLPVSVIVLDDIGRTRLEKKYPLGEGFHEIELNTADLSEGSYNAWIDLGGQTVLRSFQIAPSDEGNAGWLGKIKDWFV